MIPKTLLWPFVALLVLCAMLYGVGLEHAPIHVHYDEVLFGLQAHSIAKTGHDTNGRWLPLYFQVDVNVWYQPIAIYFTALVLKLLPLSDTAIRLPTMLVGLFNITLMYFVAWHIFGRRWLALLAAALLALTPAHFIHSRVAVDYLYPIPFVLVWLLCLLIYRERKDAWLLFAAASSLGLGFYSYIASVVMMPVYLAITFLLLWLDQHSWRSHIVALAGFTWPLLLIPPFFLAHPEILGDFQARYRLGLAGSREDPLGALYAIVNNRTIAERWNLYHDFFSPGFLFVSGGSNVTNSTREAGVFLVSFVVFLAAGAYDVLTRWTREKALIALGFLTAPLAACLVVENYAIDRALGLIPFGVLLATLGIARLREKPRGRTAVVFLLLLGVFQFQYFYRDYFGDYGPRSSAWYGNNIQGAIERAMALDAKHPAPKVLLSEEIRHIQSYWRFYLQVHERSDMLPKGELFKFDRIDIDRLPVDTLLICLVNDSAAEKLAAQGTLVAAATATDPNDRHSPLGPGEHVTFVIYRKVAPVIARVN